MRSCDISDHNIAPTADDCYFVAEWSNRQLTWLITKRLQVRVLSLHPSKSVESFSIWYSFLVNTVLTATDQGGVCFTEVLMKDFARKFYNSKKWKCCRSSFIAERINADGGLCQVCHERTGYIVHHKITLDSSNISKPEIALNHDNLMYVCKECHDEFEGHFNDKRPAAKHCLRVVFDEDGEPVPR